MKKVFFLVLFFYCLSGSSQSIANYATSRNTGITFSSISSSGNSFSSWRNATGNTQDDNRSDFTNIGFDFWYNGVRYDQFSVSTNGFLDFSSSTDDGGPQGDDFGYDNTAFTANNAANATRPAIAPFYDDLTAQGNVTPLGNSLKYAVTGSAPNRTLTVEWINMAVFQNVTPSLNFQVKLVESLGIILVHYGSMVSGNNTFSYSMGLNGPTVSASPTTAQLKELQSVNGNSFSNSVQNNLSAMPTSNSQYIFTPPIPTAVSGNLTFVGVSQTSMALTWTNWASNHVGYVIYNSTDGSNFNFVTQVTAATNTAGITGLLPSTTYYWRVYAVTEGCLSNPLNGTQATSSAGNKISIATGNWNTATTWSPTGVPTAGDNVIITNGHVVSINANGLCNNLTVGQGSSATLRFNGNNPWTLNVNNNVTINNNASFLVNTTSNQTHSLIIEGNLTNAGTIDFAPDGNSLANTIFTKDGNLSFSGTGNNNFNLININLGGSISNMLEITASNFTAATGFLDIVSGTLKISTANAVNIVPFNTAYIISSNSGLWLNSANLTANSNAGVTLYGKTTITNGTLNIGNASNENFEINGGTILMNGGVLNIAGNLDGSDTNNPCNFEISGGTLVVPTFGSTNTSVAPFHISGGGSVCNLLGGTIVIQREGGSGAQNLGFTNIGANNASVLGGTLQIGNASTPAGQTIDLNTDGLINNLLVNSSNATARLNTNALSVRNNITISNGSLDANNLGISLGGNWSNNGSFVTGTGAVTFSSTTAQSIFKTGGEIFNDLNFAGTGIKTFSSPVTANGNFSIASTATVDISASNFSLTVKKNLTNNGTLNTQSGLVTLNGTTSQNIGGTSVTNFYDLTLNNTGGALLTGSENLLGTLTLSNGALNTNSQVFTMVSTSTATARIAQITGSGDITGNVVVQRYIPGSYTGWALLGNPISSALTLNDWDDDLIITCPTCPDGSAAGFSSIYTYDETLGGLYDNASAYVPLNSINDAILTTKGYWVYVGTSQYTTTPITLDVTGTVRKNNFTMPLNYTNSGSAINDGWNLIYNPYPSAISWSALRGSTSNLDNAIYAYSADLNSGTGGFASYVNGVSSPALASGGVGDNIPMSQGFYVHSTGATALNALESNKVAANPTFLKPNNGNNIQLMRINLKGPGANVDETVLYFQPNATDTFDQDYDAYKMRGQDPYAPSIALEKGNAVFQINAISPLNGNYTSALKTLTGYSATYTISASDLNSFPNGACISLYDKLTAITTDLRSSDYVFNLVDTTTVARFNLSITINSLTLQSNLQQPSCNAPNSGRIKAKGTGQGPWNYYWKSNGNVFQTSLNKFTADSVYNLNGGNIDVEVNTTGMCDNVQQAYVINQQLPVSALFSSADTLIMSGQGAMVQFNNLSSNALNNYWDFGTSFDFSNSVSPIFTYVNPGVYQVILIGTSATGCKDTAQKSVTILSDATSIEVINERGNQYTLSTLGNNMFLVQAEFEKSISVITQIRNLEGKLLQDAAPEVTQALHLKLDLNGYAPGIYFLTLTSEDFKKVIKLTVD